MIGDLPLHAPGLRSELESDFVAKALGRREARHLAALVGDAEKQARSRLDAASQEVEAIFERARQETNAILALLPDLAALRCKGTGSPKKALQAIRSVSQTHNLPIAAVTGRGRDLRAATARTEAVKAVAGACPDWSDADIGVLFGGLPASTVRRMRGQRRAL